MGVQAASWRLAVVWTRAVSTGSTTDRRTFEPEMVPSAARPASSSASGTPSSPLKSVAISLAVIVEIHRPRWPSTPRASRSLSSRRSIVTAATETEESSCTAASTITTPQFSNAW